MKSVRFLMLYALSPLMVYGALQNKHEERISSKLVSEMEHVEVSSCDDPALYAFSTVSDLFLDGSELVDIEVHETGSCHNLDGGSDQFEDIRRGGPMFEQVVLGTASCEMLTIEDLQEKLREKKIENSKLMIGVLERERSIMQYQKKVGFCTVLCPCVTFGLSWLVAMLYFQHPHC